MSYIKHINPVNNEYMTATSNKILETFKAEDRWVFFCSIYSNYNESLGSILEEIEHIHMNLFK